MRTRKYILALTSTAALALTTVGVVPPLGASPMPQEQQSAAASARQVGTITAISGNQIKIKNNAGAEVVIVVPSDARLLRAVPGEKSLASAPAITLQDLQVGDRVLVRGNAGENGAISAQTLVAMKSEDIAKKQEHDRMEWQLHGVGGLVQAVDPAAGTVTISTNGLAASKTVTVKVSKQTMIRRYAPNSVKFDDATVSTLAQVKPGDQLRARGAKNAEGTELAADEIVSGAFRNVAGTVLEVDAATGTLKVMDLATKKPVEVKITPESQMHQLPPFVAMRLAARLKGVPEGTPQGAPAGAQQGPRGAQAEHGAQPAGEGQAAWHRGANGAGPGGVPGGQHMNGQADMQQILANMPAVSLSDLKKDQAVMIVATEGSATSNPTAITLLTGVEPILTASPSGSGAATILSPWNLSTGGEGEAQ